MAEFVAASAAVLLVPSIKGFRERLKSELDKVNETVKVGITLNKGAISKAEAEIETFKKAAEKGSVKTQLELDVKKAEARLTELRIQEQARKLGIKVEVDTKQADLQLRLLRAEAEARAIKMRLEVDTDGVKKEFEKLTNGLGEAGAGFKKALTLNLQVIGLSQLPAVGLALASVTQSMVALGQSSLLLPGILSGVASSFATLLVGLSGVKGAFTAYRTAVKDSAQDATRAKDATRALTNANRDLAAATRDAKRNQEDLNAQLRDAPLDEATALIELKQARIDEATLAGKTGLDHQRDTIAREKAESNLANTRTRNSRLAEDAARANKDGVAGNPAVLDALDRQAKAQEGLNTASKGGTAVAAALKNLSPNAQDFVTKVESMRGSWTTFKNSIQDKLFAGLGDDVVALGGKLPVLEKGFSGIASALNNNVKTALKTLSSDQNIGFFDRIFGNTGAAQEKLSGALKPLIDGFVHLGAVGSDFLPRMVDGFAHLLERFNGFIDAADKDGRLKGWIETGIQAVKDLGNSFLNIVSIVASVAEAFTGGGGQSFLGSLETGTKRLADFLKSADGQEKLKTFFHDARESFNEWLPVLKNVAEGIKGALGAGKEWADSFMPFLNAAGALLKAHPGLVQGVLSAYLAWRTISPVIKTLEALLGSNLLSALNKVRVAVGEGEGFKGKLGALSGFMAGAFTTAAAALAVYIAGSFVTAFSEGATELSRMKTKADELATSLDKVTGAADRASKAAVSTSLQNATNSVTGDKLGNVLSVADDRKIDRNALLDAATKGDQGKVDQLLAPLKATTRAEVENNEFYKNNKAMVDAHGGVDMVVGALNGNQADVKTYNDMINKSATEKLGFQPSQDVQRGLELSGILPRYDLRDLKGSLSPDAQANTNLTGALTEATTNARNGAAANRQTNEDAQGGKATLKPGPGNPFNGATIVQPTDNGGASFVVPGPEDKALEANVKNGGGDFKRVLDGTQYTLGRERALLYANLPKFATGGQAMGAGSGQSDSILARVSNGEFITRADQVAKNPALFHGLNSGAIDPRSLPGFDGGGLASVSGQAQPFKPSVYPFGGLGGKRASFGDSWNQIKAGASGAWDWFKGAKTSDIGGADKWTLTGGVMGLDRVAGTPAAPRDVSGLNPLRPDYHNGGKRDLSGLGVKTGIEGRDGNSGASSPTNPGDQVKIPDLANPSLYDPATGKYADGSGAPTGADLFGNPAPGGPSHLDPTFAGPGPGGLPPGIDALPPLPAEQGYVPPVASAPTLSAVDGIVPPTSPLDGLPANLQPLGILQQIGSVLLDAVLGFFGLSPAYINTLKQGLGLFGINPKKGLTGVINGRPDPAAASILAGGPNATTLPAIDATNASAISVPTGASARAAAMADSMAGKMYKWGGAGLDGTDCSGLVAYVADAYLGRPFAGRDGGTGTELGMLKSRGAVIVDDPSKMPPGSLRIGWNDHHTSGTLPDGRSFEASDFGIPIHVGPGAGGFGEKGFTNWAYFPAMASGGMLSGPGSGTSDSILARVSNGEFITKAAQVKKNPALFHGLNSGAIDPRSLPAFAIGGEAGADSPFKKVDGTIDTRKVGAPGGWTTPKPADPGAQLPGVDKTRAGLGAPPASSDHVLPAVSQGISGAAAAIGNAASLAASAATFGAGGLGGASVSGAGAGAGAAGAGGGGGGGATASFIGGATQIGAGIAKGLFNIGSSLLVGTATPGTTAGAYGSPLTPQKNQQQVQGPQIHNTYGDIHTASYDEFYKGQQRREQQQQAPFIGSLGKG